MSKRETAVMDEPEVHKPHQTPLHVEHKQESQHTAEETAKANDALVVPAGTGIVTPAGIVPPLLGKTPTSLNQILPSLLGAKGTHHVGPVISGGTPGSGVAQGSALCALPLQIDYTMGAFSLPIQFPPDCQLLWAISLVYTAFAGTGDLSYQLGIAPNGATVLAAQVMGAIHTSALHPVTGTIPYGNDPNPGLIYFTAVPNGNTAGLGIVTLIYSRLFPKWS